MSRGQAFLWRLEYFGVKTFSLFVRLLPERWCPWFGRRLGDLIHLVLPGKVRLGRENVAQAFGWEPTDPRAVATIRESFRHFATIPFELMRLRQALATTPAEQLLNLIGRPQLDAWLAQGKGAIFVSGHLGNWEVMGTLGPYFELPIVTVGRPVENPLVNGFLKKVRSEFGQVLIDKKGAPRQMAREIRSGACLALLLDQHAGRRGVRVEFFGRSASTFPSAALFARRFEVPIFPVASYRQGGFQRIHVEIGDPIHANPDLDQEEDLYRMTQECACRLEETVRRFPDQYLWFHRRWRPGGTEPQPEWLARYAGAS